MYHLFLKCHLRHKISNNFPKAYYDAFIILDEIIYKGYKVQL